MILTSLPTVQFCFCPRVCSGVNMNTSQIRNNPKHVAYQFRKYE